MQELATRKSQPSISHVRLRLHATDIPSDAIPKSERGEPLLLPTSARVSVNGDAVRIEMILQDAEMWGDRFYTEPSFDHENPPILPLNLAKDEIIRLETGGHATHRYYPTAVLVIRDPYEIVESLSLIFYSDDPNNPEYAIKALAKMLRERLDIVVEETKAERQYSTDEIPF